MRIVLLFGVLFFNCFLFGQHQNLIYNGSFEQDENGIEVTSSNCLNDYGNADGTCPTVGSGFGGSYQDIKDYWGEIYGWTHTHRKNALCSGVGSADALCDAPRSGLRNGRGVEREYITESLRSPLLPNSTYYIEIYYSTFQSYNADVNWGIIFSLDRPKQCGFNKANIDDTPHIIFNVDTDLGYQKITTYYKPDQKYEWITIGIFGNGDGVFLVDDIRIFEVGDDKCADGDWFLQNTDLHSWIYSAENKVVAGSDVMSHYYAHEGEVVVKDGSYVWFKAGNQVVLEPGFSTEDGAYFETVIEPGCTPFNPCSHVLPSDDIVQVCGNSTIVLGPTIIEDYVEYSWSPATYLDDPTSANPTFTPPLSGNGTIEYTLTMTAFCGGFTDFSSFPPSSTTTAEVVYTVNYFSSPDPNPQFTVSNFEYSECSASFDLNVGANTETIYYEIIDQQNGQVLYSHQQHVENNNCCNFHWSSANLPESFWDNYNSCRDYKVRIRTTNYCYPNNFAEQELIWDNGGSYQLNLPLGNIITPATTPGQNDWFILDASGVKSTMLFVYNRWGYNVYKSGMVNYCENSQSGKLWAGQCNRSLCSNSCLNEGWYSYVLFVYKCGGGMIDYSGDIYLDLDGNNANNTYCQTLNQKNVTLTETDEEMDVIALQIYHEAHPVTDDLEVTDLEVSFYPNPNNGSFQIELNQEITETLELPIVMLDMSGRVVYRSLMTNNLQQIELDLPAGVYLIQLKIGGQMIQKKLMIQQP